MPDASVETIVSRRSYVTTVHTMRVQPQARDKDVMSIVSRVKACTTSEIAGCIQKDGFVSRVAVMVTIHFRWVTTCKFVGSDCSCKRVVV